MVTPGSSAAVDGHAIHSGLDGTLEARIKLAGKNLCTAIQQLTDQVPTPSSSTQDFARALKIHRTLASRVLNAIRTDDPLAAISRMPRSEGLRMLLQAAKPTVPKDAILRAEEALREFELIVRNELGGWDGFDAALIEWLPDVRERYELSNKQLAFKGIANLMGMRADVQLSSVIYYPDASHQKCDIVIIEGLVNLRRLRPSVRIPITVHRPNPLTPRPQKYWLEDVPAEQTGDHYPLLRQFCSTPCPQVEAIRTGDTVNYLLAGNEIGENSAADIFAASVVRGGRPMYRTPTEPPVRAMWSAGVNVPAKTLLMNILLHEDVWPGSHPELHMYDMHFRGLATPDDPTREFDRMDLLERLQSLGKGVTRFRATELGSHVEIVQHVCERLGWDANRLRGYRVRVQYPLMNVQYCVAFDPPPVREDGGEA
ncbi:MAG: hypothetical protein PVJ57_09910 [Phycisphaerae bacterium]|jgi:hypothetical protein